MNFSEPFPNTIIPILPVDDVAKASEYLRDRLGFTIERTPEEKGYDWILARRDSCRIMLVPKDWPPGCVIHVEDVDAAFSDLSTRGAVFESPVMNQEYGWRDFTVRGPDDFQFIFSGPWK
jgi:hypothetical protein